MDLTDLRLLVNIIETESVTRGGDRTFMSLPAASNRVKHLETELRVSLLDRNRHGVTATPAGFAFARNARLVLQQMEILRSEVSNYAEGDRGRIRIHATASFVNEFMPEVLSDYLVHYPDVSIDLQEHLNVDIVRNLLAGKADLGIVSGPVVEQGLTSIRLFDDPMVLATSTKHPHGKRTTIRFEEVIDEPHVGLYEGSTLATFMQDNAARLGKRLNLRVSVASYEVMCRMIAAGLGVGVIPASAARRHNRDSSIRLITLEDAWAARTRDLLLRDAQSMPGFAMTLVNDITTRAQQWAQDNPVVAAEAA